MTNDTRKMTHGISGYRLDCRCAICVAAETQRKRDYRAQKRASSGTVTIPVVKTPKASAVKPSAVKSRKPTAPASSVTYTEVRTITAPVIETPKEPPVIVAAPEPITEVTEPEPVIETSQTATEASGWSPGLWDELYAALQALDTPEAINGTVTLTLDPQFEYPELLDMIESWDEVNPTAGLQWTDNGDSVTLWLPRVPVSEIPSNRFIVKLPLSAAPIGKCWSRLDDIYQECDATVATKLGQMSYKIDGKPVCLRHFNMTVGQYPERCEARKIKV